MEYEWDRILFRCVAVARQTLLPWEKAVQERSRTADVLIPANAVPPVPAAVQQTVPMEPQDVPVVVDSDSEQGLGRAYAGRISRGGGGARTSPEGERSIQEGGV